VPSPGSVRDRDELGVPAGQPGYRLVALAVAVATFAAVAACGSSPEQAGPSPAGNAASTGGDIPDAQVFLRYQGPEFSLEYPEGWQQTTGTSSVVFQDKDNRISAEVRSGSPPSLSAVTSELASAGAKRTDGPRQVQLPSGPAVKTAYQAKGQADAITGKQPTLAVDRYYIAGPGHYAVVELASPVGVDNVDAYRRVSESFRWQ
jgi:hypothetical protein